MACPGSTWPSAGTRDSRALRRDTGCRKRKDGTFSRFDFAFDKRRNLYVCPAGKMLTTTGRVAADNGIRYLAAVPDCRACPLKAKCCPGMPSRRIVRDLDEDAREWPGER
jgi:hypothetical protein